MEKVAHELGCRLQLFLTFFFSEDVRNPFSHVMKIIVSYLQNLQVRHVVFDFSNLWILSNLIHVRLVYRPLLQ